MECINCRHELPENASFCGFCGTAQDMNSQLPSEPQPQPQPEIRDIEMQAAVDITIESDELPPVIPVVQETSYSSYVAKETPPKANNMAPIIKTSVYFWNILVMFIPGINLVMLLIWSFSENLNPNRRNFARAALIWMGIFIILSIIILAIIVMSMLIFRENMQTGGTIRFRY